MTDVVRDAIATLLAEIEPVTALPVEPIGYGSDLSCVDDLDESMGEVEGIVALGQALYRRLDCPRGALPDDLSYGISLTDYLNAGTSDAEIRAIGSKVAGEFSKDDRVDTTIVTPTVSADRRTVRLRIRVLPVDPKLGPFTMTLAATSAGVVLEAIGR